MLRDIQKILHTKKKHFGIISTIKSKKYFKKIEKTRKFRSKTPQKIRISTTFKKFHKKSMHKKNTKVLSNSATKPRKRIKNFTNNFVKISFLS